MKEISKKDEKIKFVGLVMKDDGKEKPEAG
jgi:hypothetical protein